MIVHTFVLCALGCKWTLYVGTLQKNYFAPARQLATQSPEIMSWRIVSAVYSTVLGAPGRAPLAFLEWFENCFLFSCASRGACLAGIICLATTTRLPSAKHPSHCTPSCVDAECGLWWSTIPTINWIWYQDSTSPPYAGIVISNSAAHSDGTVFYSNIECNSVNPALAPVS